MTFNPNTAYIGEAQGWPQEIIKYQGFRADRRVRVNWDDRYNWANYFLFTYPANATYPYFAAAGYSNNCAIMSLAITPDTKTRLTYGSYAYSQAEYGAAFIDIRYETAGFNLGSIFQEEFTPNTEQQYWVPPTSLTWSDGSAVQNNLVIDFPSYTYRKTYFRENLPSSWYLLGGTTNSMPFACALMPIVINTNCGLSLPGEIKDVLGFNGQLVYSESKNVKVRGNDWNQEWDPVRGVWDYVYMNGNPIKKYSSTLFQMFL